MATSSRHLKELAKALVDVSSAENALPEVLMSVHAVRDALNADRSLARSLTDSVIPVETRQNALKNALKGQVHVLAVNALLVLQQEGLLDEIPAFAAAVLSLAKEEGHRRAEVTSAIDLKADERHKLEKALADKFGGTVELVLNTDPSLIGGLVVNVDGWRFDGSVLGTCTRLASALAEA